MSKENPETTLVEPAQPPTDDLVPRGRALRRLWRAEVRYSVGLATFAALALLAHYNNYFGWDLRISRALQSLDQPWLLAFMRAVSFIGNSWHPYALAAVTVFVLLAYRFRSEAAGLALSTAGCAILNTLVKALIARPRPSSELVMVVQEMKSLSFPSGHVSFYVSYFGFLFFAAYALLPRGSLIRRVSLVLLALPVLLIGLSRVYLGAHWPSDTIGAYLFSGMWLGVSLHMYRKWKARGI